MLTIKLNNIFMEYGDRALFHIKSNQIYSGDKIGIIGANGCGKTTLLNIIAGKVKPTSGSVYLYTDFSYIEQLAFSRSLETMDSRHYAWGVVQDPKSGGEIMRQKIAEGLGGRAGILLCDEPTSNLDERGIVQLEKALLGYKGSLLLVSHDRALMDRVCNKIWEIDGALIEYRGNYTDYLDARNNLRASQQKEYDKYQQTKKSLEAAITNRSAKASGMKRPPKRMGNSEARLHRQDVRQKAGKVSKSSGQIKTRLKKLDVKERPSDEPTFKMTNSNNCGKLSKIAIRIEKLRFEYGENLILDDISLVVTKGEKIAITGGNGSGKTSLLNCIVHGCEGVKVAPNNTIGYFEQNCVSLYEHAAILGVVMSTSTFPEHMSRTVLAGMGIKRDDVHKKISVLSGGERCKVALSALICSQPSILILDEPTNYLDIYILSALEEMLTSFDGTLLLVSHDRYFREKVTTREIKV